MNAVRLVAEREFGGRIRDRSFLISTALTAVILMAVILVPRLVGGNGTVRVIVRGPDAVAVISAAQAQARSSGVQLRFVPPGSAAGDRARARSGDVDALLDGDTLVSKDSPDPALLAVLESAHRFVAGQAALAAAGIDPAKAVAALAVPPLRVQTANPTNARADQRRTIAFIGTVILYGQIIGYGFWVAVGVVEEKSSRVVEVLLATIRPRTLLSGKIIGIGVLGLVQLLLLGVAAVLVGRLSGALQLTGDAVGALAVVIAWFLLGYAFYASVFAAAAARVSRQEEVQNVTTPVTMVLLASFIAGIYATNSPGSTAAQVLSVVPPFSALVAPPRIASGAMPGWQLAVSVALMLLAVLALVRVAARLYEGAVLRTGGKVSLREAWRRG